MEKKFPYETLNETIEKDGWLVTGVPGMALYTVGLMDLHGHPEIAIHGMSPENAYQVLYSAVKSIEDGLVLPPGEMHEGVLGNGAGSSVAVKSISVDASNFDDWFGMARIYHRDDLQMVQVLWPDSGWKFPDEEGYDAGKFRQLTFDVRRSYDHEAAEFADMEGRKCACGRENCTEHEEQG